MQAFPRRVAVARAARLNLDEDECRFAVDNEVNLAKARAVVASDQPVVETLEVFERDPFSGAT